MGKRSCVSVCCGECILVAHNSRTGEKGGRCCMQGKKEEGKGPYFSPSFLPPLYCFLADRGLWTHLSSFLRHIILSVLSFIESVPFKKYKKNITSPFDFFSTCFPPQLSFLIPLFSSLARKPGERSGDHQCNWLLRRRRRLFVGWLTQHRKEENRKSGGGKKEICCTVPSTILYYALFALR